MIVDPVCHGLRSALCCAEERLNWVFVNTDKGDVYFCPGNRQYYSFQWRQGYSDSIVAHPGVFAEWTTCLATVGAGKVCSSSTSNEAEQSRLQIKLPSTRTRHAMKLSISAWSYHTTATARPAHGGHRGGRAHVGCAPAAATPQNHSSEALTLCQLSGCKGSAHACGMACRSACQWCSSPVTRGTQSFRSGSTTTTGPRCRSRTTVCPPPSSRDRVSTNPIRFGERIWG